MTPSRRSWWLAGGTLAAGLAFTGLLTFLQGARDSALANERFDDLSQRVTRQVMRRMQIYEYGLRGLRGAVLASGGIHIGRRQVLDYSESRDIDTEFPGARGFGVIFRVAPADEKTFVAAARRDGWPDFAIRQLEPYDGERAVIKFVEPVSRNLQAIGLDVASEPNRRLATQASLRNANATITAPITLVQASGKHAQSFLLMLPIYRAGAPIGTIAEREAAGIGWAYAPLVIDEVLHELDLFGHQATLSLHDVTGPNPQRFFVSPGGESPPAAGLSRRIPMTVYGRQWQAEVRATPAFIGQLGRHPPAQTLLYGAAASLLLAMLAYWADQAAARQRKVRLEQARRSAIVENSPDAIVAQTPDGLITEWNGAAERLFGYTAAEVLGRPLAGLLLPAGREAEEVDVRMRVVKGEHVPTLETTRCHRDGTLIDVSVSASPVIDANGRCIGLVKTVRDIRHLLESRRMLAQTNQELERQVQERTERLNQTLRDQRAVMDAVPSMIGYWDRHLVNRFANKAYSLWFGVNPDELPGRSMLDLLGPELFERNRPFVEAALRGEPQTFERGIPKPDGTGVRHALAHYLPDTLDGEVRGFYVLVHDVTELTESRSQLAAAMRENTALLQTIERHAIVSVTDVHGRIVSVNEGFCRISGYSTQELLGQDHRILNSGTHGPEFWSDMWRTIGEGHYWHGEVCNRAKDGSLHWVDSIIAPFLNAEGEVERYVSVRTDITPIKRLQQEAEASRRQAEQASRFLREVTDRLPLRIAYMDADRRYRFANELQCRALGLPRHEVLGRSEIELRGDMATPQGLVRIRAALAGDAQVEEFEERHDETTKVFERRLVPDRDAQGRINGLFVVCSDVTERKRIESDLRHALALQRAVLDASTQVSIVAVRVDGTITVFNRGSERLLGYRADEVVGKMRSLQFHDLEEMRERAKALSEQLDRVVRTGNVLVEPEMLDEPHEWTYRRKNGTAVPVLLAITAMRDDRGELVGYLGVAHDISVRKQYETSLRQAIRRANEASQAKSQFLANMSHEIRTPLNAVLGLTYLLERTDLDDEQTGFVDKIKTAGRSLLSQVNDVLDLSKIEASQMRIERAPFSLHDLMFQLHAMFGLQAEAKGIRLRIDMAPDLPDGLEGDELRLRQVLTNLVSNALKFTERGSVQVSVQRMPHDPQDQALLRFGVRDTGIGISQEAQDRLFRPFVQADDTMTRRYGGTGLGLSIVKQLVGLMDGEVHVSSTPGHGSEFVVELAFPLCDLGAKPRQAAHDAAESMVDLQGVRVLLVDDSPINLDVARRILGKKGALVSVAADGRQAVDFLRDAPDAVDVVLMDVQMPVLDGLEATRIIRQELRLTELPIIALTAGMTTDERDRAANAGMSDLVGKPFNPSALASCIRRHVPARGQIAAPPQPVARHAKNSAASKGDWPWIDGIQIDEVRLRLGGDFKLFASLLRRMLDDVEDIATFDVSDADGMAALAARMHDLKGTAGTLGAREIERQAAQAQAECRAGNVAAVPDLMSRLAEQIDRLRTAAAEVLSQPDPLAVPQLARAPARIDPAALSGLIDLLRAQDLAALDRFAELAPELHALLGASDYAALRGFMHEMQFAAAAALLARR